MTELITEFVKTILTWLFTGVLKKYLGKYIDVKKLAPYVAYVVSFILTLIAFKFGYVTDPTISTVVSGAGSNSLHSWTKPLRRKE